MKILKRVQDDYYYISINNIKLNYLMVILNLFQDLQIIYYTIVVILNLLRRAVALCEGRFQNLQFIGYTIVGHSEFSSESSFYSLYNIIMKSFYVYILTNNQDSVLYIGVTNNLARRFYEHKNKLIDGFTKQYQVDKLIYYEEFLDSYNAISREKQLKNWHKDWKWNLILKNNSSLKDLSEDLFEDPETSSG